MDEQSVESIGFNIAMNIIKEYLHSVDDPEVFARIYKHLNNYCSVRYPMLETLQEIKDKRLVKSF